MKVIPGAFFYLAVSLGTAFAILLKLDEKVPKSFLLASVIASFGMGMFAPEMITSYFPKMSEFINLLAFICAIAGNGLALVIYKQLPKHFEKKMKNIVEDK